MALDVEAVAQPQRTEIVFGELPGQEAARLVAELRDALVHEPLVDGVVLIHGRTLAAGPERGRNTVWICADDGRDSG